MAIIRISKSLENSILDLSIHEKDAGKLRDRYIRGTDHRELEQAYILSRMPATYAAIVYVLKQLPEGVQVESALDIGSGPGTGFWVLSEIFTDLQSYTGLESDSKFISYAKKLIGDKGLGINIDWVQGHYPGKVPNMEAELVLMSYTLNENSQDLIEALVQKLWDNTTSEWFVIVEPGTSKGFQSILTARDVFIRLGASIIAPCIGNALCPLKDKDWCHFSVRLERPQFQKVAKSASLNYEDEKLSYLIVRRSVAEVDLDSKRIIKKPMKRQGHISLDLCSEGCHERRTVSKSEKARYSEIKRLEWGDIIKL